MASGVTDLSRYNPDNPCRPPCSVCSPPSLPSAPRPPFRLTSRCFASTLLPSDDKQGAPTLNFRRATPLTRTDGRGRTQTPAVRLPAIPPRLLMRVTRTASRWRCGRSKRCSFPPQQVSSLDAVIMNMYSMPNPGIPGCPPGLEYLTQVRQATVCYHRNYN